MTGKPADRLPHKEAAVELHKLTDQKQQTLKLGIMALYQKGIISELVAERLIQSLGLSNA